MLFIPSMKDFTRTAAAAKSLLLLGVFLGRLVTIVHSQCFQDESMNAQWAQLINGDDTSTTFSIDGTCCQETVCNVPCAAEVPPPPKVCEVNLFFVSAGSVLFLKLFIELLISHITQISLDISSTRNSECCCCIGIWHCRHHFDRTLRYHWLCHLRLCQGRE